MYRIHNTRHIGYTDEVKRDIAVRYYEIFCDTTSDLPTQDSIEGAIIDIGSLAYVIDTNQIYMMNSSGSWILQ